MAKREIRVYADNQLLRHNKNLKYMGITLDRILSLRQQLQNAGAKLRTRSNILHKLCETTAAKLRCSVLGLVYSTAEYYVSIWFNTRKLDALQLTPTTTKRLISGTTQQLQSNESLY